MIIVIFNKTRLKGIPLQIFRSGWVSDNFRDARRSVAVDANRIISHFGGFSLPCFSTFCKTCEIEYFYYCYLHDGLVSTLIVTMQIARNYINYCYVKKYLRPSHTVSEHFPIRTVRTEAYFILTALSWV